MSRAAEFEAKLIKDKILADEARQKAREDEKNSLNSMRSQMREKATKDKTRMLDLLASLKAKGNVQKSDLKLFGIDEAKFEGRGSDAVSRSKSKNSGSNDNTTEMENTKMTFMTAPNLNTEKALKDANKTASKMKPVKATEIIVETEAEEAAKVGSKH
jgi:hypothetical protein